MSETNLKKLWDKSALSYYNHTEKFNTHRRITQLLLSCVTIKPKTILDFGCGPGNSTTILLQNYPFAQVTGIDYSSEMINIAQKHNQNDRVKFIPVEIDRISSKYDLIVCSNSFFHVEDKDSVLQKIRCLMNNRSEIVFSMYEFIMSSVKDDLPYKNKKTDDYLEEVLLDLSKKGVEMPSRLENREKFNEASLKDLFERNEFQIDFGGMIKLTREVAERNSFFKIPSVAQEVFGNTSYDLLCDSLDSALGKKNYNAQERIIYSFVARLQ